MRLQVRVKRLIYTLFFAGEAGLEPATIGLVGELRFERISFQTFSHNTNVRLGGQFRIQAAALTY